MDNAGQQYQRDEDGAEPVSSGILAGTLVRTLDGILPVEFLEPGDRVITRTGARKVGSISVSRRRMLRMIRITASTLGHDRPEHDLLVAPGQPVVIRDWRALTLFGKPVAVVPAQRLVDGKFVVSEVVPDAVLFTLRFAEDEVIWAEGLEISCGAMETEPAAL